MFGSVVTRRGSQKREAKLHTTASNSIPVARKRAINQVEIEEKGRFFVLVSCVSRCSLDRRRGGEETRKKDETGI